MNMLTMPGRTFQQVYPHPTQLIHLKSYHRKIDRQEKLDGLEAWYFHAVLLSFFMLLQISFFLFGIALSAFVWSQQGATAIAVIVLMAFGLFFYLFIVVASLKYSQCPFQTPASAFLRFIWECLRVRVAGWKGSKVYSSHDAGKLGESQESQETLSVARSMRWIFNTSADPEVITSAAWLLPTIKWAPEVNMPAACSRLLHTFTACFHVNALLSHLARQRALACGRALHHLICNETIETVIPSDFMRFDDWSDWRHLSLPWGLERCKEYFVQYTTTLETDYKDNARLALQLAIVTGCEGFLKPTDVALVWDGVFDWKDDRRTTEDFDWLVDFLVHFRKSAGRDFDAMGDALLALSAMRGMGSVTRRDNHLDAILFAVEPDKPKPSRLRHAALRAMFGARFELVNIVDQEKGEFRDKLLKELAPALFTAAKPIAPQRYDDDPDALFNSRRDGCYLQLIFTLAKQSDWSAYLRRAGHMERCTSLLDHVIKNSNSMSSASHPYYLAGALIRMNAPGSYGSPGFARNMTELEWWELLKAAWSAMYWNHLHREDEIVEALPDIVTYTLDLLKTPTARYDAASLARWVDRIYKGLREDEAKPGILSAVKFLRDALSGKVA
ncbi:uncharacterized protein EDB93DRAFT_928207 [Suillus bovinus]|uniref:uncharacterized protein n=1 Tax=Suillus bovinus TaxID=48563 RepID=UPI001B87F34E|nr:uncharacterized protein EDB93DRAFT_928207 [Suillus bovinus]KAG2156695.1 hypothetical protein EDB93DRAFT_928207 [Suillus bovinus]